MDMTQLQTMVRKTDELAQLTQDAKSDFETVLAGANGGALTPLDIFRARQTMDKLALLVNSELEPIMATAARVIIKQQKQIDDLVDERDDAIQQAEEAFLLGTDYSPMNDDDDDDEPDDESELDLAEEHIEELTEELAAAEAERDEAYQVNQQWQTWAQENGLLEKT